MIKIKVKHSDYQSMPCSLIFDEMAIHKYIEWDGRRYYGLVDVGTGIHDHTMASQVLTFMLVAVNES